MQLLTWFFDWQKALRWVMTRPALAHSLRYSSVIKSYSNSNPTSEKPSDVVLTNEQKVVRAIPPYSFLLHVCFNCR